MMYGRSRGLSLLARGQGMVEGGVEVECLSDNTKDYSLTGQPFLEPSGSQSNKPYRAHTLKLPTTYITKRGKLVLFTAPEDMIIGRACHVYEKEITSKYAARDLRTTSGLMGSALGYSPENDLQHLHESGYHRDTYNDHVTLPGHFTNVYLKSLQKSSQQAKLSDTCLVEDIEQDHEFSKDLIAPCNSEAPPVSECDSGLGPSLAPSLTSRLSAHSRLSVVSEDGLNGPIVIPHASEETSSIPEHVNGNGEDNILSSLKKELSSYKKTNTKTKKSVTKPGKKRQRPKSTNPNSVDSPKPLKAKSQKNTMSSQTSRNGTKTGRSKRRRNRKDTIARIDYDGPGIEDGHMETSSQVSYELQSDVTTALHLSPNRDEETLCVTGQGGSTRASESRERTTSNRSSRAEERRAEIERKRAEKRELEAQKKRELEEKLRLEEEIAQRLLTEDGEPKLSSLDLINDDNDNDSMASTFSDGTITPIESFPLSNQSKLRASLDKSILLQRRWLLEGKGERVEKELTDEIREAQEAIRRAREVEEERRKLEELRKEKLEEERLQQQKLEEAARAKATEILSQRHSLTNDNNQRLNSELSKQRQTQPLSKSSLMFSYFNYVPPPKTKRDKKVRGRTVKTKAIKG